MKKFRWNETKEHGRSFWDSKTGFASFNTITESDKNIINGPASGTGNQIILEALCRIISELVEIEENRNE